MKNLLIVFVMLMLGLPASAMTVDSTKDGGVQALVTKTGFKILNANKIPHRMNFLVNPNKKVINAVSYYSDRKIVIYAGAILYIDNEDELAAILSHEISHSVDSYNGIMRGYFSFVPTSLKPRKYEFKADKRAVDYMVKAGYNPLAMITMANKLFSQPRYEWYSTHPTGSRRMAAVYEYIYAKYPEYLVQNEYKDNVYYQNFLLTSRENRLKLQEKIKNNSKKRVNYL